MANVSASLHTQCPVDYLYESCINVDQLEPTVAPGQLLQEAVHPAVPLPQGVGHVAPGEEGLGWRREDGKRLTKGDSRELEDRISEHL